MLNVYRKFLSLALAATLIVGCVIIPEGTIAAAVTSEKQQIVASTAGGQETGNEKEDSYDNDLVTRWCNTNSLSSAWIQYDLGSSKNVTEVKLKMHNGSSRTHPIKIEVGDSTLTQVWSGSTSLTSDFQTIDVTDTIGRYVKITMTAKNSAGSSWFSINETEVWGSSPVITLNPIADAYVRGGTYGDNNYGSATALDVKIGSYDNYKRISYLKFDYNSTGISSISKATLRLYLSAISPADPITATAYKVTNDNWSESTIAWNTAPVLGNEAGSVSISGQGQYYDIDVTSYVSAQLSVDKIASFAISDAGSTNVQLTFNSKEAASNPPMLVIETSSSSSTPTPTTGPTPTPTTAPTSTPTPTPTTVPAGGLYEAEAAVYSGPSVKALNPRYTGTGYLDFGSTGHYVEWTVNAPSAGSYDLVFRYADTYDRTMELKVNGTVENSSMAFPKTFAWTTWRTVKYTTNLNSGSNTIRITATGTSAGNIDSLQVAPAGTLPAPTPIPIPSPVKTHAELSYRTANFDLNTARRADISTDMTLNGNTLSSIKKGTTTLVSGTDYTKSGNKVTIKKEYLQQFASGTVVTLTFDFTPDVDAYMYITIIDTTGTLIANVMDYGAVNSKTVLSKDAFNAAVDYVAANGGGIVDVPPGDYLVASVHLKSNVTLNIQPGATLWGELDQSLYTTSQRKIVYAYDSHDVKVTGGGRINARATELLTPKDPSTITSGKGWVDNYEYLPNYAYDKDTTRAITEIIKFTNCTNVTVENVTLEDSPKWTLVPVACDYVTFNGVNIKNNINCGGNDGIDIVSSRHVTVKNCDISTSDDAIVIKVSQTIEDSYDILVENCTVASVTNGLKIGTETQGNISNVTFRNCKVYNPVGGPGPEAGIAIEMTDGYVLDTVTVQNITIQNARAPIFVKLGNRNARTGTALRNVLIENVTGTSNWNNWYIPSSITGFPGVYVENVTLRNIDITCQGYGTAEMASVNPPENSNSYPKPAMFGELLPAYGFYNRHVNGLTFDNVSVTYLNTDLRPMIVNTDVLNFTQQ